MYCYCKRCKFPEPSSNGSQPPITPSPGYLKSMASEAVYTHMHIHTHTLKGIKLKHFKTHRNMNHFLVSGKLYYLYNFSLNHFQIKILTRGEN